MDLSGNEILFEAADLMTTIYSVIHICGFTRNGKTPDIKWATENDILETREILEDKAQGSHKGAITINLNRFTGQSNPLQTSINRFSS